MARTRIKQKLPSRIKYEKSHPTISFRTTKEMHDALVELKEAEGKSAADVIKLGLGMIDAQFDRFEEGQKFGWKAACELFEERHLISYRCSRCGQVIKLKDEDQKKAIIRYIEKLGWHHKDCSKGE